jgi:2-polyprenyl-6-methoxyphenol hydroxylase-like FAD-dependent oxidoreductase
LGRANLCGCDGAHCTVRHGLVVGFPGEVYDQPFYVADAEAEGPWSDRDFTAYVAERTFCLAFPVRERGMFRFIGVVPEALRDRDDRKFDDLRREVEPVTGTRVTRVNWFSAYRVHHRVVDHFREGRVFLSGDTGHVHSQAGGQGMNTVMGTR